MRWPLQPLQPFQQTQLQPPFGQSVASLCHPWFTTTNFSYRFPIFETSATALCGTTGNPIVWETVTISNHIQVDVHQIAPLSDYIDINFWSYPHSLSYIYIYIYSYIDRSHVKPFYTIMFQPSRRFTQRMWSMLWMQKWTKSHKTPLSSSSNKMSPCQRWHWWSWLVITWGFTWVGLLNALVIWFIINIIVSMALWVVCLIFRDTHIFESWKPPDAIGFPSRCFTIMNVCSCRIAATSGILIIILESLTWGKNKVSRLAVCSKSFDSFWTHW